MYAACFILHMSHDGALKTFIDKFSKRSQLNDIFIEKNYNYHLRNCSVRNFLIKKKKDLSRKRKILRKKMMKFVRKTQ